MNLCYHNLISYSIHSWTSCTLLTGVVLQAQLSSTLMKCAVPSFFFWRSARGGKPKRLRKLEKKKFEPRDRNKLSHIVKMNLSHRGVVVKLPLQCETRGNDFVLWQQLLRKLFPSDYAKHSNLQNLQFKTAEEICAVQGLTFRFFIDSEMAHFVYIFTVYTHRQQENIFTLFIVCLNLPNPTIYFCHFYLTSSIFFYLRFSTLNVNCLFKHIFPRALSFTCLRQPTQVETIAQFVFFFSFFYI